MDTTVMSLLRRRLTQIEFDLRGTLTWKEKLELKWYKVLDIGEPIKDFIHYYDIQNFISNIKLFTKLAWKWRSWDSHYSIQVLVALLKENAKACKNGYSINSEKTYRRGMTAAGKLEKAYNAHVTDSKAFVYLIDKYGFSFLREKTLSEEEKIYFDKRYCLLEKKLDKQIKDNKTEAWAYLHKYIEQLWD